jgi:hypothetical protein
MPVQGQIGKILAPYRAHSQERDLETVTIAAGILAGILAHTSLGILHKLQAEFYESTGIL